MTSPKTTLHTVPDQQQMAPLDLAERELSVIEQALAQGGEMDPTLTQILSALVSRSQALNVVIQSVPALRAHVTAARQAPDKPS